MSVNLLPVVTAKEIVEAGPIEPEGWVKGYLPKGCIVELTAKIKSGKTTFILNLCRAILESDEFMERETEYAPILYLTEEGPSSMRAALNRAGLGEHEDLFFIHRVSVQSIKEWDELCNSVHQEMYNRKAKILIVDTLARWARLKGEEENTSGAASKAMEPLERIATDDRTVIVSRHDKRGEAGDFGDWGRGSSGFGGAADLLLNLSRANQNGHPNRRILRAISRFDDIPEQQVIELLRDGGYAVIGDTEREEAKLDLLSVIATGPKSFKELQVSTGLSRSTLQRMIDSLESLNTIQRIGSGTKNDPFIYGRPGQISL